MKSRIVMTMLSISIVSATTEAEQLPVLPSPQAVVQAESPRLIDTSKRVALATTTSAIGAPTAAAGVQEILKFDYASLRRSLATSDGRVMSVGGAAASPQDHLFTISVGSQRYDLALVAQTADPELPVSHLSFQIVGSPGAYARLSVGQRMVAGTLVTHDASYRLLSTANEQVAVIPLGQAPTTRERLKTFAAAKGITEIERRHVYLERVAELAPRRAFASERGRYSRFEGGQLGMLTDRTITAASVEKYLRSVADITFAPNAIAVSLDGVITSPRGRTARFHQVVRGIPVYGAQEISIDQRGAVTGFATQFIDPSAVSNAPVLSSTAARAAAIKRIETETRQRTVEVDLLGSELFYTNEGANGQAKWVPTYVLKLATRAGSFSVKVDAHTGESVMLKNPQIGYRVCGSSASAITSCDPPASGFWNAPDGQAPQCLTPGAPKDGGKPCRNTASQYGPKVAMEAIRAAIAQIEAINPDLCCSLLGSRDVLYTTATSNAAEYDPATGNIRGAAGSSGLASVEAVWHEYGHHVLYRNGSATQWISTYGQPGKYFETAFAESFADLFAAAVVQNMGPWPSECCFTYDPVKSYGDPWIHADGNFGNPAALRNLKDPNVISFGHMTTAPNAHEAGRAISKYFYRVINSAALTAPRILEYLMTIGRVIRDFDSSGAIDLYDLREAFRIAVKPGETDLAYAVDAEWNWMFYNMTPPPSGTPPVGIPVTVPNAPALSWTSPSGACPIIDGIRTTDWNMNWSASAGADFYHVHGQSNVGLTFDSDVSATFTTIQTNVTGYATAQACKWGLGCSGPSPAAQVYHTAACNW